MRVSEYVEHDATGLACLISSGQVSAGEVQRAALQAIEAVNRELNALVGEPFEEPLAHKESGPFSGVPFLIKDLVLHAEGVPSRSGSRMTGEGVTFPYDSDLMTRFRSAGLATLGRTATPEFGFNASTESVLTGPTRNPWNPAHSAGGSSGGSGALVAARAVPVAHANDGGGSIRIPAAVNGLVGLKPTRGRVPLGPDFGEALNGAAVEFVLTRTVRDCAALLDAVHGPGIGDKYYTAPPGRPFAREVGEAPGKLRVAFTTEAWSGVPVDAECVRAVEGLAALLEELGYDVTEASPDLDAEAFDRANSRIWFAFLAGAVATYGRLTGNRPSPETLEATTLACSEAGNRLTALDMLEAEAIQNQITRTMGRWFLDYDVLLTPTLAHATFPLGLLDADDPDLGARDWYDKIFRHAPFTALFNMTGQPAMSLPVMTTGSGGPVGIQLVARFGEEATLIRLAARLEEARPWDGRRPPVCAGTS
ncbi:amidase [Rubrobacter taiwanensis]|jgi:amidase|uniref:Amidase n=1 Tax=Rubrobacter taiwanensis TaxID=185139 RepID=A0A4R1BQS0_9ACTN|nr:amidase family protein [Rubrobacter taiwanensis]TCJ19961.1 amidase [Rubrobacter taiwanensis]